MTTRLGYRRIYEVPNELPQRTQVFSKAVTNTLSNCVQGATFREVLRLTANPAVGMESIARAIHANPVYSTFLRSLDLLSTRIAAWEKEEEDNPNKDFILLQRSVRLLNRTTTRNLVAVLQLNRLRGDGLPRKKTDKLSLLPESQLHYANLAEEDCTERGMPGSELGFLAGYHYDVLFALYTTRRAPMELTTTLEKSWNEGIKAARIAATLATHFRSFHYHPYIYAATLVAPIGKILMAELFPQGLGSASWLQFTLHCEKFKNKSLLAMWVGEFHRFGLSYSELSGLLVNFVGLFSPIESAIYFHCDPQNLMKQNQHLYRLSELISVSIALGTLTVEGDRAAHLNSIHLQCLKDLEISLKDLDLLVERALK